ncbi:MAG: alkylphosphonate utilization protein [Cocleimonas sp.]|nr:alkylphosphonate utilization protein [Cocleimonas sp.]
MTIEQTLQQRSDSKCELCTSDTHLNIYEVPPESDASAEKSILICDTCHAQIEDPACVDINHWRCLNDSMWNPEPAIQVMAWRMLNRLKAEGWAHDLLDMLYLEPEVQAWAEATHNDNSDDAEMQATKDSNGNPLIAGDTIILIKDLVVKGAGFTAKRGTMVKNISLTDNPKHIEGRVNGTRIVLVSAFLKKA